MMKRLKKLFIMMMSLTVFLSLAYTQVCAYGYKVTLYTGNQGTINSQNEMSINVSKGQMVSLDLSQIELPQDSKYYVKGIRLSGHDSVDNLDPATFVVNGDLDYVVVYVCVSSPLICFAARFANTRLSRRELLARRFLP